MTGDRRNIYANRIPPPGDAALLKEVCFSEELWRWGRNAFFATEICRAQPYYSDTWQENMLLKIISVELHRNCVTDFSGTWIRP